MHYERLIDINAVKYNECHDNIYEGDGEFEEDCDDAAGFDDLEDLADITQKVE